MYSKKDSCDEEKKKQDVMELIITSVAGLAAIIGIYIFNNNYSEKPREKPVKDYVPAFISVQECNILQIDGNDSSYDCKETEKIKIRPEVYVHFQNLDDRCVPSLEKNNLIVCYDIEKDKIKDIKNRKKIDMDCIISKTGEKLKCVRKF